MIDCFGLRTCSRPNGSTTVISTPDCPMQCRILPLTNSSPVPTPGPSPKRLPAYPAVGYDLEFGLPINARYGSSSIPSSLMVPQSGDSVLQIKSSKRGPRPKNASRCLLVVNCLVFDPMSRNGRQRTARVPSLTGARLGSSDQTFPAGQVLPRPDRPRLGRACVGDCE
jgi:hypothetical protein